MRFITLTDTAGRRHAVDIEGAIVSESAPDPDDRSLWYLEVYLPRADTKIMCRDTLEHIITVIGLEEARRMATAEKLTKAIIALVEALSPPRT